MFYNKKRLIFFIIKMSDTSLLPFDCKEIFEDTLSDTNQSDLEKFQNGFDKLNDVMKDMFSSLKDEGIAIGITIGAEIGLTGLSWLLKRFIKKAVTRIIFMMITGGFDILDAIQMAQIGTELIRGLTGVPLNIRIDKEIITGGFEKAYEAWNETLNQDVTINCYRRHYLDFLKEKNPKINYTQEYVNEFLNDLMAIYKVVTYLDSVKIPEEIIDCMPCTGFVKKIVDGKEIYEEDPTLKPSFCKINENESFHLGYPTDKCNNSYTDSFMKYINSPYSILPGKHPIDSYDFSEVKREYGDKCNIKNDEYYFCIKGNATSCNECLTARLLVLPVSLVKNKQLTSSSSSYKYNKKYFLIIIIIIISFLLYFLIRKNVKSIL